MPKRIPKRDRVSWSQFDRACKDANLSPLQLSRIHWRMRNLVTGMKIDYWPSTGNAWIVGDTSGSMGRIYELNELIDICAELNGVEEV